MRSTIRYEVRSGAGTAMGSARLYVAWQDPHTRSIEPVAHLDRIPQAGRGMYEFRYLRRALQLERFRPFLGFPDPRRVYRSEDLFPFFENRIIPRERADYGTFVNLLGLEEDADPFEVLARSAGRRQTDTIEVFPGPTYDDHSARCRFLLHGIRHIPGAEEACGALVVGDRLRAVLDPQNPTDPQAVLVRDEGWRLLGWIPRYLTGLIHEPLRLLGPGALTITVAHVAPPDAPIHLRLLCAVRAEWRPSWERPLSGGEFDDVAGA